MQIGLLGPLEVRDGDRWVAVPGQRLRTLLLHLALDPGRWLPAGSLADAVWRDDPPSDPVNALQSLVSRLRRLLGPDTVDQSPAGYRLAVAPDDVDAVRFTRLVTTARQLVDREPQQATAALDEALALWRGEPATDDDLPARRARLVELRIGALRDRALLAVRAGRAAEVLADLEELSSAAPLREDVAETLMDALAAAGRPADALAAYERTRQALGDALGTDPSPALRARHLDLLRRADAPLRPPTNLRAPLTSFVGRDDDVRAVRQRLAEGRLTTVVGTGGSGKTRLATETAATVLTGSGCPDGVWVVELAPVSDPAAVAQAVLEAMGVRDVAGPDQRPRPDTRTRLVEVLSPATCLLVLDNCEHLVEAAADLVAELLGRCPGVRVLATSREPLGIDGEVLYPLGPLAVPQEGAEPAASPAVQLLVDRARAVSADVRADASVVEIVRRLDGLPLAIELAAARLRVLSPSEVADRLGNRFRLLTGGRRTATPRHRTLRAVVEWSWELLTPLEREVAEHFAVFAAGAGEDAVVAVCPGLDAGAASDVLLALVDKSLLVAHPTPVGTRFRMLETLREYGAERLTEQGRITAARTAHAAHQRELARTTDARLRGPDQLEALRVLDTERDDSLAALLFLADSADAAGALDLAAHLGWYWLLRENGQDGGRWLRVALDVPGAADLPLADVVRAVHAVLTMTGAAMPLGDPGRSAGLAELAERLHSAEVEHPVGRVMAPLMLLLAERPARAAELVEHGLTDPHPWVRAAVRLLRNSFAGNEGDIDTLRQDVEVQLSEWEAVGDRWGLATTLSTRGHLRALAGDLAGAAEDYERAQALARELGSTSDDILVTMRLADLRLRAGDTAGARRHLAAMRAGRAHGQIEALRTMLVHVTEAAVALTEGDDAGVRASRDALVPLLAQGTELDAVQAHGTAAGHATAAALELHLGRPDAAEVHVREGHRLGLLLRDRPVLAAVAMSVAGWAAALGRPRDAAVLCGAAARLRGAEDPTDPLVAALTTALRDQLGAEFDPLYAEGRAMDADAATARLDPDLLVPAQARRR